jgi:hypothetical protein
LDLLQEISNRLRLKTDRVWEKITHLAYDSTFGLLKQYRRKLLELVRIALASVYLQFLRAARKHLLLCCFLFFGTMLSAVAAVVVPVAMVILMPWSLAMKMVCLLVLGSLYIGGTAWAYLFLFSQENWMKLSGMNDLMEGISSSDSDGSFRDI